ncbi:DUF1585 domain-containing protein [Hyalangium sp.]|uniref:DUF1585 domain-containing protein n=1 Tax=Hyalangium sp. TaxID=2028555 RepID=UPI002D721007|nr:DUF1585 domain-containing protein [Hyalangium sp.]HYI02781.1 DUF1585 domain-containing protein [Hyalangium sp.]
MLATPASAEEAVCEPVAKVPLQRHLRQLSLDLLGRPPTIEEYQAVQAKGSISPEDIRQMMDSEEFYGRMRGYHRALLRSNVSASVFDNGDTRMAGTGLANNPFGLRGNTSTSLRGVNNQNCDAYIEQDSCNAQRQDPHSEPATKVCRDEMGIPLPVSYDYDTNFYACRRLDTDAAPLSSCTAVPAGQMDAKYLNFCDMRRLGTRLAPYLCLPDPAKSTTSALTQEEVDGTGKVVAFVHPSPPSGTSLTRLDRCTLDQSLRNGIKGAYVPQRGCVQREGYVTKSSGPFFATDPAAPVTVCAIEAQERDTNPWTMESCQTTRFARDRSCGCGVGMRRCEVAAVHTARVDAINKEPELLADSVVRRDEPYFNILTTRRSFVNGTMSEFYRQQQGVGIFTITAPANPDVVPAVPYSEAATWAEYTRDPQHAGVLTTPSFLHRFPTQRARVSHFYEAFLCKTFVPSSDPSPPPEDNCNRENNLARRCGCNYCHATIEPTGAHWGRFDERNALFLNEQKFPRFDPKCRDCALAGDTNCGGECGQYVMQAFDGDGANSLGMLKTYLYRTPDEEENIVGGPQLLVERMLQTGDLERCAVKRIWSEFLGRPMSAEEQRLYLQQLSDDFSRSNYSLKTLVEKLLTSDAYRRID